MSGLRTLKKLLSKLGEISNSKKRFNEKIVDVLTEQERRIKRLENETKKSYIKR